MINRSQFSVFLFSAVLVMLLSSPSSTSQAAAPAHGAPAAEEVKKPDPSQFKFNENVTSRNDLIQKDLPEEEAGVKIVYRTPDTCGDFASYLVAKQSRLVRLEKEIKHKEENLKALKAEFDLVTEKFTKLETRIQKIVQRDTNDLEKNPNFAKVVKLFEMLSAEEAAERMKNLDLDLTLEIMKGMSPKKLTQVMAAMDPRLSAALSSQMIRGF